LAYLSHVIISSSIHFPAKNVISFFFIQP
jgi:hypothetical protein